MNAAILDTGPLVAWFCPRDHHHAWARQTFLELSPGCLICEAVLAETCHLVAKDGVPRAKVLEFVKRGRLSPASLIGELSRIGALLDCYADAPMDFADACVVRLAELNPKLGVCTVDAQFRFFRKNSEEAISLIAPFITSSSA
jgi:predicted nucleic acid-binding protein